MSRYRIFGVVAFLILISSFAVVGFRHQTGQIDRKQLRDMLVQLGYTVKDLETEEGKEKYSTDIEKGDLNIPVAFEISPSNTYIWLTVNVGEMPADVAGKSYDLLKQNADVQPSFFYVTSKGKLMLALAIENHEVTNDHLRQRVDKITSDVVQTKEVWQRQG